MGLGALLVAALSMPAQEAKPPLAFEVASIKPAPPLDPAKIMGGKMHIGMSVDAARVDIGSLSLADLIRIAYKLKQHQLSGPEWMSAQRFDVLAKMPEGATKEQVPEMLQALLAERFKLTMHRESKDHAIYALIVGKNGAKLKPTEVPTGGGAPGPQGGRGGGRGMQVRVDGDGAHLQAASATLAMLSEMISRFSERPVVDMTGITGQYDFDLVFSPETLRGVRQASGGAMPPPGQGPGHSDNPESPAGSIYDSVQKYGLKLDPRKAPMEVLLIDHIEKAPSEN